MNADIDRIIDKGEITGERLVIKILSSGDIGRFGIFRTGTNQNGITNRVYDTYWFPDKVVNAGDLVVLYTNVGPDTEKLNDDGTKSHFFHWGKSTSLWQSSSYGSVLVSIPEWRVLT